MCYINSCTMLSTVMSHSLLFMDVVCAHQYGDAHVSNKSSFIVVDVALRWDLMIKCMRFDVLSTDKCSGYANWRAHYPSTNQAMPSYILYSKLSHPVHFPITFRLHTVDICKPVVVSRRMVGAWCIDGAVHHSFISAKACWLLSFTQDSIHACSLKRISLDMNFAGSPSSAPTIPPSSPTSGEHICYQSHISSNKMTVANIFEQPFHETIRAGNWTIWFVL